LTTTEKQALSEPVPKPDEYSGENVSWQSGEDSTPGLHHAAHEILSRRGGIVCLPTFCGQHYTKKDITLNKYNVSI
jgi:hypothetical protein